MNTAYVILKKGFEYNDEVHSPVEGGSPDLIFFTKEEAKIRVKELNSKEFKSCSLTDYCYDLEDLLNVSLDEYENFNESLNEKYGKPEAKNRWESFENRLHPMANEEETMKYTDMVNFDFYEVVETSVDMSSFRNKQLGDVLGQVN